MWCGEKKQSEPSVLYCHLLLHFVSRCCTVAVQRSYSSVWHNDHSRTRTYPSKIKLLLVTTEYSHNYFALYQNKIPKNSPTISSRKLWQVWQISTRLHEGSGQGGDWITIKNAHESFFSYLEISYGIYIQTWTLQVLLTCSMLMW